MKYGKFSLEMYYIQFKKPRLPSGITCLACAPDSPKAYILMDCDFDRTRGVRPLAQDPLASV